MASYTISPIWGAGAQLFDNNGVVLSGGKIFTYLAGTTTPATTYTNPLGTVFNTNPIVLNAAGRPPNEIWFPVSGAFKFVLTDANNVLLATYDNIPTIPQPPIANDASSVAYEPNYEVSAGNFTVGQTYLITFVGSTDFVAIGAAANVIGVRFTATGAGAGTGKALFSTTTQTKLRETVSVKDFGAVGNGVTNDTTAVQAAFNSGAKQINFVAGETYLVSSGLTLPTDVQIEGNGATITASSSFTLFTLTNGGAIRNLNLIGSVSAGTYDGSSTAINMTGVNNHPAAPTYVTGPKIENCTLTNFGFMGVRLRYVKKAEIRGNRISNVGYTGVAGLSCDDVIVDGNTIVDVTPGSGVGDAYGVFIDRENGLSETSDPRSYRCIITNNIVRNVIAFGGGINGQGIDTHAGVDFVIDSNVIEGCQRGIFVTSSTIGSLGQRLGAIRCVVSNNTISGTGSYGILLNGANDSGAVVDWTRDCVVTGNTITGFGDAGDSLSGGVVLQWTKNTVVSNNSIKNSRCNLIVLNAPNIGFNIAGNVLTDPWDSNYTSPNCIRIGASGTKGVISNNHFRFEDATLGTYVAVRSIRIESTLTGLDVELGRCSFEGIDATHLGLLVGPATGVSYYGFYEASGTGTVTLTSGGTTELVNITFPKRFPYAPTVTLTPQFPITGAGKTAVLSVGNVTSGTITATGFRAFATAGDAGAWPTAGTVNFIWSAR